MTTLAQTTGTSPQTSQIVLWVALLLGVVLVGSIVIFAVRRRLLSKDETSSDALGVMESLRAMRDTGRMSDDEFDAARKALVAKMKTHAERTHANPGNATPHDKP